MRKRKKIVYEGLEGKDGTYVKSEGWKTEQWAFWLRFASEWFTPCEKCQRKLDSLIRNSEQIILGNSQYDPPVELSRKFKIDDSSWKEIDRRPSTPEERERLKKSWFE